VPAADSSRREQVLHDALEVFARLGFGKATMADVAEAAGITRTGLYFLFDDKRDLLISAVTHELDSALHRVRALLSDETLAITERLVEALDRWLGQHNGEATREVGILGRENAALLEPTFVAYRERFVDALAEAISSTMNPPTDPRAAALTLHAAATGWKRLAGTSGEFRADLAVAARAVLRPAG
jgi:AcrR family transcriptional regulator